VLRTGYVLAEVEIVSLRRARLTERRRSSAHFAVAGAVFGSPTEARLLSSILLCPKRGRNYRHVGRDDWWPTDRFAGRSNPGAIPALELSDTVTYAGYIDAGRTVWYSSGDVYRVDLLEQGKDGLSGSGGFSGTSRMTIALGLN